MGDLSTGTLPSKRPAEDRLDSWKEIATYVKRDLTTVQRWEKREGMPVHRHLHDKMGSVYAFRAELDIWTRSRNLQAAQENENNPPSANAPVAPPNSTILTSRRARFVVPLTAAGIALASLGAAHSVYATILILSVAALGIYSVYGPFYSLPGDFLTGFAAASGIALVSSLANLGGFAGPYATGWISQKTGSLYGGLAVAGVSLFASATLMLLLPRRLRGNPS